MRINPHIFKAYDIRGKYPSEINEEAAERIGRATALYLNRKYRTQKIKILVCRDLRISSEPLKAALAKGIISAGCDMIDGGIGTTPFFYFLMHKIKPDGGIMITASHNPKEYNGFKLRGRGDVPILGGTGLEKIVALTRRTHVKSTAPKGSVLPCRNYRDDYVKFLCRGITIPNRLRVVVDAAGGATSLFLPKLLSRFSNLIYKPLFFEPDGSFKRHPPNPFLPDAQIYAKKTLESGGFNFGVIFDGDGDRIVFLDEKGDFVHPDYIAALLAEEELKTRPGSWFVFTANTSKNAWEYIQERGGKVRISRVGYVFMQGAMKKTSALIGSEISGHYCFKEFFNDDSALLAFLRLADFLSHTKLPLSQLIKTMERYVTSEEINFSVQDKGAVLKRIQDFYQDGKISRLDGISVDFPDWWFNLRPSNTEPYIRLVMEARTQELYDEKMKELERIIGKR